MRYIPVLLLVLALIGISVAQEPDVLREPDVLTLLWADNVVTTAGEWVGVVEHYVGDINNDGYSESCTVTTGKAGTRNLKYKNHITVFGRNGSVLWHYGVDDVIRDAVIYDLNNDNKMEFVISSGQVLGTPEFHRGAIRIIGSDGNLMRSYESTAVMDTMYIDDLDGDSYYEIAGGSGGRVYLFHSYGEDIWFYPPKGSGLLNKSVNAVYIGDVDGDGVKEVIAGADYLYYINDIGRWMGMVDVEPDTPTLKRGFRYVGVTSLEGGDYPDTFAVTESNNIVAVGIEEVDETEYVSFLKLIVRWTTKLGCNINDIETRNIDTDRFSEILVACSDNKIYAVDNNGGVMWDYPLDGEPRDLYIKDIDEDNMEDLLVAASSGSIYLLDMAGNFKWRYKTNSSLVKVAAGDIDGDRVNEIVVVSDDMRIEAYTVNKTYTLMRKADTLFNLGQVAYISSDYRIALDYFRQAKEMYVRLGYERGSIESQSFITRTEQKMTESRRDEADIYYSKAQDYFFAGDYSNAQMFAEKAKAIYQEFGNTEGIVKCELLLIQIDRQLQIVEPTVTLPRNITSPTLPRPAGTFSLGSYMTVGLVLLLVLVIVYIIRRKREKPETIEESLGTSKEVWEKGMVNTGGEEGGGARK